LLINRTGNEALCVQAAHKFNVHSSCQLQHLFLCCNTLREALYYLEKFSTLLSDELEIQVTRTRDNIIKVKLPVADNSILAAQRRRTGTAISTLLSWLRHLHGVALQFSNSSVLFPAIQNASQYSQQSRSEIEGNAGECATQFHSNWLDEGLHNTNPHILNM